MTKSNKGSKTKTDLSQTNAPEVICPSCGYSQILSWRGKYLHLQCTVCQTQWMPEIVARVLGPRLTENELNELRADLAAPADEAESAMRELREMFGQAVSLKIEPLGFEIHVSDGFMIRTFAGITLAEAVSAATPPKGERSK